MVSCPSLTKHMSMTDNFLFSNFISNSREFRYTTNHRETMIPLGLHDLNITFMNPDSVDPTGGWGEYYGLKYTFTAFQIARGMNDIYVCFPFVEMDFFKRFVFYSEYARILRDGTILWRGRTFKKVRIGDNK